MTHINRSVIIHYMIFDSKETKITLQYVILILDHHNKPMHLKFNHFIDTLQTTNNFLYKFKEI